MKPVLVVYATRHGLARRVAERVASRLRERGETVDLVDAGRADPASLDLDGVSAALLVASVHAGRFHPEMVAFARHHREGLARLPATFFAVSMTAAGVANRALPRAERDKKYALALKVLDGFATATGWTPLRVHLVAGAVAYRKYGFWLRQVMRFIAWRAHSPTDTSRDHELTDWAALDGAADQLLAELRGRIAA